MRKELPALIFLLLLSASVTLAQQAQSSQAQTLAFTHVTVIDVAATDPKRALKPNQTVVVTGNRIAAVGRNIPIPKAAQVIDARDEFLMPGLWDMHVHSLTDNRYKYFFPMLVANGITGVREMGNNLSLEETNRIRQEIAEGKIIGPRLGALTGRILDGAGTRVPVAVIVTTPDEGRQLVRSFKQQKADFIKVYDLLLRDVYLAVVDEAKRQNIPVAGHVPFSMTAAESSDLGQSSIEHTTDLFISSSRDEEALRKELQELGPLGSNQARSRIEIKAIDAYDERKAAALFSRFVRNNTWQCPTLIVRRVTIFSDLSQLTSDERLKYMPPSVLESWRNTFTRGILPMASLEQRRKRFQKTVEIVGAMQRAGVGILAGTDSQGLFVFPGFALHDELALLVQAGLTPLEALRSATLNPAKFLGLSKSQGTIKTGAFADLVLLDANPLDQITNTQRIAAVVANGRYLPKTELQKILSEVEAAARK